MKEYFMYNTPVQDNSFLFQLQKILTGIQVVTLINNNSKYDKIFIAVIIGNKKKTILPIRCYEIILISGLLISVKLSLLMKLLGEIAKMIAKITDAMKTLPVFTSPAAVC